MRECNAYLVESIPIGMESLEVIDGVKYHKDLLIDLTNNASETIDLTAMYLTLKPNLQRLDEKGFKEEQILDMGGNYGRNLFYALERAAKRGVKIRIIHCSTFEENEKIQDLSELKMYKNQVEVRRINMKDWYDGGRMHLKIWIVDNKDIHMGSANMDWRSLTQVKELGIVLEDQPEFSKDVIRYFGSWWHIASIETPKKENVSDPAYGFDRTVPAWSPLVPKEKRLPSPLKKEVFGTHYNWENPMSIVLNGQEAEAFITGCPVEFCAPGRTYDGDALVKTILEAQKSVCINVMDFAPVSLYRTAAVAWWPLLFDALMRAVITNGVQVRLLVSKWAFTHSIMEPFLRVLKDTASAGRVSYSTTSGSLEIRLFCVPGWQSTVGPKRLYPGHTRVNHTKYIVTDNRLNIGTSNMTWDNFHNYAGASFNTNHPGLVKKLQEIFDRDWESKYAYPF